jgi:hypothetical protein
MAVGSGLFVSQRFKRFARIAGRGVSCDSSAIRGGARRGLSFGLLVPRS